MNIVRNGLLLVIPLASLGQEVTVVAQAPPVVNSASGPNWLWIALGIWLVLGSAACISCVLTDSSSSLKDVLLTLLLGPLAFVTVILTAKYRDKIGVMAGLTTFGLAIVFLIAFLGHGTHRDWSDAERILNRAGNGTTIPISDVFGIMGHPDKITPSERSDSQCYWWDKHGVLVSENGDAIGTCYYVPRR